MNHNLILSEVEFEAVKAGKSFIVTAHDPIMIVGDSVTFTKEGTREQLQLPVGSIETDGLYKGNCVIGLHEPIKMEAKSNVDQSFEVLDHVIKSSRAALNDLPDSVGGGADADKITG